MSHPSVEGAVISMMIDILSGTLTGASFGTHIGPLYGKLDTKQDIGHLFGVLDIDKMIVSASLSSLSLT